ncbi:MAG: DUF1329 domain-containing protein [Pseudomonas sp.]|uniref:DUF1329 domain-containing protein n=1 Tax=Pseudomonas sp. TaxID=306 RepID=UPI003D6E868B
MKNKYKVSAISICLATVLSQQTFAAVSPEEAAKLNSELTPVGAIKAGNADGTIPAWTGGLTDAAKKSDGKRPPQLFASEKPLITITAGNLDKYADKLTDGAKYLLKNYQGYKIEIYPTHRTGAAPQYIYDRSISNATKITLQDHKMSFDGFAGGVPFPIPKTGEEAMFNMNWNWRGADSTLEASTWFVSSSGKRALTSSNVINISTPYNYPPGRENKFDKNLWGGSLITATAPAYSAGEKQVVNIPRDAINMQTNAWVYLAGQRRLRKAPNVQYDVPNNFTSGLTNFDDSWGFSGATDRYDWKLIGRQEFYVPYLGNSLANAKAEDLVGEKFINPEFMRWELHRVWVVEANLKAGARHVVPKRRLYIDEDTWTILTTDLWDAKGQLWKSMQIPPLTYPEIPLTLSVPLVIYNFQSRDYALMSSTSGSNEGINFAELPATMYTPQYLERSGVR